MKHFTILIKYDFVKRIRSYTFLITLCASLAIAYTFVPAPGACYSTISLSDNEGENNSARMGYVSAMMSSILLSLMGFYLVNGEIQKDKSTRVGQIMAATQIRNSKYLFAKVISNFLLLLTILGIIFSMNIALFFMYGHDYSFELVHFIKPYLVLTVPAIFFIAVLSLVFEVVFGKYTILQNVVFFFCFTSLLVYKPKTELGFALDVFGDKIVANHLEEKVSILNGSDQQERLNIGYTINKGNANKKFTFSGFNFPTSFLVSRILWVCLGFVLILGITPLFHRFNIQAAPANDKKLKNSLESKFSKGNITLNNLPTIKPNFGILPLVKMELLMLLRKGKRWLWSVNILGMGALCFLPMDIAHKIVLPILWFLQVHRLSDLMTKDKAHDVHYLSSSSKSPIKRLLNAQLIAAIILLSVLSSPLVIRQILILNNVLAAVSILLGSVFLVLLSALMGLVSKGKKLFELTFFLMTYANINAISFLDYFGGLKIGISQSLTIIALCSVILPLVYIMRNWNLKRS
ncbi:MAG: ABC transporter permease [Croceivirga sp.]